MFLMNSIRLIESLCLLYFEFKALDSGLPEKSIRRNYAYLGICLIGLKFGTEKAFKRSSDS